MHSEKLIERWILCFLDSKLERLHSELERLDSKLECLDSRLDTRSFRVSRIEDKAESLEFRATVNLHDKSENDISLGASVKWPEANKN